MKVQIQTTQNVDIEYDLATLGDRMGAALIDILIIVAYWVVMQLCMTAVIAGMIMSGDRMTATAIIMVLYLGPWLFYGLLCEVFMNGQTIGKKAMQIKVVRLDGGQASVGAYLLRWLVGLLELQTLFGGPAIVASMVTRSGQRLGDLAAGTTVVKVKRTVTLAQTILARVEEDYEPAFPAVTRLNDVDIAVIKGVITSRERAGNPVVLGTLTRRVKETLGVETDLPSLKFLRTVVKDYNFYASK